MAAISERLSSFFIKQATDLDQVAFDCNDAGRLKNGRIITMRSTNTLRNIQEIVKVISRMEQTISSDHLTNLKNVTITIVPSNEFVKNDISALFKSITEKLPPMYSNVRVNGKQVIQNGRFV